MKKYRVAIAGAGNIAQNAHLPALIKRKDIEIVAICDINLARAKECAQRFGIPAFYASIGEMLAGSACDVVDICAWNSAHCEIAVAAAQAGCAILCEKPMALNEAHALQMQAAVQAAGVPFMMAMPRRFFADVQYLHGMVEAGLMGEIYYAKTSMLRRRGTPLGWFTDTKKSGGGPVIDIGVHAIDCAWYLMGRPRPVRVSASTSYAIGDYQTKGVSRWVALDSDVTAFDTEDSAAGLFHFENGASLAFDVSWAINMEDIDDTMLCGSLAGARFRPGADGSLLLLGEAQHFLTDNRPRVPARNAYEAEIDYFFQCLRDGAAPDPSLSDGVTMIRMLMGIYQSAREGREILL